MKAYLPNSAFLGNIDPFLRRFDPSDPEILEISSNKKWISLHPMVLSMVAALGLTVGSKNIVCDEFVAKSKHYLERMGLFKMLDIDSSITINKHEPAGRFIPLASITNSDELTRFITDMIPLLHLEPRHGEPIKYIVSELVRNVLEHANSDHGAILCAQYYKKSNTIRIGIADTGVGVKEAINRSHSAQTHLDALRLALMPGITGTTKNETGTEFNAGAGLFFIKSIAKVNRDFFVIYSGDSMYKLLKGSPGARQIRLHADPFGDRHSREDNFPAWKGTVIGIDISLAATREFSILLDLIRKTYVKTIKERKKERFRRPKFI